MAVENVGGLIQYGVHCSFINSTRCKSCWNYTRAGRGGDFFVTRHPGSSIYFYLLCFLSTMTPQCLALPTFCDFCYLKWK